MTRGNGTRLNSQVMMGGGCAVILHENLATEPCVTTSDVGWIVNDEIPARKGKTQKNQHSIFISDGSYFSLQSIPFIPLAICPFQSLSGAVGGLLSAAERRRADWNSKQTLRGRSFPETGLFSATGWELKTGFDGESNSLRSDWHRFL